MEMEELLEYLKQLSKDAGIPYMSISLQIWRSGMCVKELGDTTACSIINSKLN